MEDMIMIELLIHPNSRSQINWSHLANGLKNRRRSLSRVFTAILFTHSCHRGPLNWKHDNPSIRLALPHNVGEDERIRCNIIHALLQDPLARHDHIDLYSRCVLVCAPFLGH